MRLFGSSRRLRLVWEDDQGQKPVEQIRLLSNEVNRQLGDVRQKESALLTQSGVLVAASSVLTSVQFKDWQSYWQIFSTVLFVVAAIIGVLSIYRSRAIMADAMQFARERLEADSYSLEYSLLKSHILVLENAHHTLDRKTRLVSLGYVVLVAAWLVMLLIAWITVQFV